MDHAITLRPLPLSPKLHHVSPEESLLEHHTYHEPAHPLSSTAGASTAVDPLKAREEPIVRSRTASTMPSIDLENDGYQHPEDPLRLGSKIKTPNEITNIRRSISHKKTLGPIAPSHKASRARNVQKYYEVQNENIERLLKPVSEHVREAKAESESDAFTYKIAVNASFICNVLLAVIQVYGAVASGSLSLFTTMADALFDPLSNLMLILSGRAVKKVDPRKFPSGKARIETAGNIVFCFLMTAVSFILIAFSAKDIADGAKNPNQPHTEGFHLPSVIAVGVAFTTKLCLFLYCYSLKNKYSQINILWEDHRNDLFINGFGLFTSVAGSKLVWWVDPMGAILLSILIATLWQYTAYGEFQLLIGVSADTDTLRFLTYISMTHSPDIIALDTVRAWHSGPRLIVEVDIVMDAMETLRETHDVAEALQMKIESLPNIERAYVHVDFETTHAPEHFWKKEM